MLRELSDVTVMTLYNLYSIVASGRSARRPEQGSYHFYLQEGQGGPRELLLSLTSISGKLMERLIVQAISRITEAQEGEENYQ